MQGLESLSQFKNFMSSLGGLGRYEDTYMVHAAEGETVIPMEVLDRNPVLKKRLFESMRNMGIDPGRYIVGHNLNSLNPLTGQPEFFLKKIGKWISKVMPGKSEEILPYAAALIPGVGPMTSGLIGAGLGATIEAGKEHGGSPWTGALMGGLGSGLGKWGMTKAPFGIGDFYKEPFGMEAPWDPVSGWLSSLQSKLRTKGEHAAWNPANWLKKATFTEIEAAKDLAELKKIWGEEKAIQIVAKRYGWNAGRVATIAGVVTGIEAATRGEPEDVLLEDYDTEDKQWQDVARVGGKLFGDDTTDIYYDYPLPTVAHGGIMDLQGGGESQGPGTGTSDSIPAMLSDGEFVMTADAVRGAGGGDRREGARKMYETMDRLEARV